MKDWFAPGYTFHLFYFMGFAKLHIMIKDELCEELANAISIIVQNSQNLDITRSHLLVANHLVRKGLLLMLAHIYYTIAS